MKAVALLVLLSLGYVPRSYAADDAPLADPVERCYTPEQRANIAKVIVGQDARIKSLEADAGKVAVVPLVVTAVLAIGAGFALGFGVARATAPKQP